MRILFLTHRLPYAPNRGDRVRAYHELRALATAGHEVHVLSLAHDEEEAGHAADMRGLCASVHIARVPRVRNLLRALPTLAGGRPLTHALLDSPDVRPTLGSLVHTHHPNLVLAFCSGMARFALEPPLVGIPFVLDMVDVDSGKWRELAKTARLPLNLIYAREARVLGAFEADAARHATVTYVVNTREADALRGLAGPDARIEVLENGVDLGRYDIGRNLVNGTHAERVLGRDCGDGRGAVNAECGKRLEIGLDARTAARVGARNGQRSRTPGRLARLLVACHRRPIPFIFDL